MIIHMICIQCSLSALTCLPIPSFPNCQMVAEVSASLTWVFDNVGQYGGDASNISLVGHSAGGHIGGLVMVHRCASWCGLVVCVAWRGYGGEGGDPAWSHACLQS